MSTKKGICVWALVCLVGMVCAVGAEAQRPVNAEPDAPGKARPASVEPTGGVSLPRLMKFSAVLKDSSGQPRSGIVGVTFALYEDQQGGAPLWLEVQNLELDEQGRYTVLLGATQTGGLPVELFAAGRARWLGIQVQGEEREQGRILLVSVPYALKAGDAETLGGKPASAFVLAEEQARAVEGRAPGGAFTLTGPGVGKEQVLGGGTVGRIAKFTAVDAVGDSALFEDGASGNIGLGTTTPAVKLHVVSTAANDSLRFESSVANGNPSIVVKANTPAGGAGFVADRADQGAGGNLILRTGGLVDWFIGTPLASNRLSIDNSAATPVLNVLQSGNVGIGTTAPGQRLEVVGNLKLSGVGSSLIFPDGSTQTTGGLSNVTGTAPIVVTSPTSATRNIALNPILDADIAAAANIAASKINRIGLDADLLDGLNSTAFAPATGSTVYVAKAGDTMTGTLNLPANGLVAGTTQLVLSGGNVGIGTATPTTRLDVSGDARIVVPGNAQGLLIRGSAGNVALRLDETSAGGHGYAFFGTGGTSGYGQGVFLLRDESPLPLADAPVRLRIEPNGDIALGGSFGVPGATPSVAGAHIVTKAGNVGIGTATPGQRLEVVGNILASGSVTANSFAGDGSSFTNLNASNLASGTVADARLSANVALRNAANTFTGNQSISGSLSVSGLLSLPATTGASTGVITLGGSRFVHNFGIQNTFVGANAGNFTLTGANNTASGASALAANTTGADNTASGAFALQSNTTGFSNTASGLNALRDNTTGTENTATGRSALISNTTGFSNTASGVNALRANTTGGNNTAIGWQAGFTATGANANTTGSNNTFIGFQAGPGTATQLTNATAIGANALVSASNALVLGDGTVNVGIGTATPTQKLEVVGNILASGSVTAASFAGSGGGLTSLNPANLSAGTAAINISGTAATATTANNALALGGVPAASFARLDIGNTFTANQTFTTGSFSGNTADPNPIVSVTQSGTGPALLGQHTATAGATVGVKATVASTGGIGVLGEATATTGLTIGVKGSAPSTTGQGVFGDSANIGVRGVGTNNAGVAGESTTGIGVRGTSTGGPSGIEGNASALSGIGVRGVGTNSQGIGVEGFVNHATGPAIAVRAQVQSPNGTAGLFWNVGGGKILSGLSGGAGTELFSVSGAGLVTGASFAGSGAGLTNLNASNLASGTVPDARIAGTYSSGVTFSNAANSFAGNGAALTNVNASLLGGLGASSFAQLGVANTFQWRAEPVGNNTPTPSGQLSLLFGSGATAPAATGLSINASGTITFATGQSFPQTISDVTGTAPIVVTSPTSATRNIALNPILNADIAAAANIAASKINRIGLDADLLDGLDSTAFAPVTGSTVYVAKAGDTMTGTLNLPANGLVAGTTQLVLSGGNVGIGTATPNAGGKLTVAGNGIILAGGAQDLMVPDGEPMQIGHINALGTLFTERMRITSTGSVGIGTTTPLVKLHVVGQGLIEDPAFPTMYFRVANNPVDFRLWRWTAGGTIFQIQASNDADSASTGALVIERNATAIVDVSFPAGNVGVGTTAPTQKLEVVGNVKLSGVGSSLIFPDATTQTTAALTQTATDTRYVLKAGDTMTGTLNLPANGLVAGTTQLVLSGGSVGIGTATPSVKLQVNVANPFAGTALAASGLTGGSVDIVSTTAQGVDVGPILALGGNRATTGTNLGVFGGIRGAKENSTDGSSAGYLGFYTLQPGVAFAERMRITSTGNVGIGTTAPTQKLDVAGNIIASGGALLRALGTATGGATPTAFNSGALEQTASAFNSDPLVNAAVPQTFQWRAEPVSSNTTTPSGKLSLLFGSGATAPAATGLSINASGTITFATGQSFPGAITDVTGTAPIVVTSPTSATRNIALNPILDANVAVGAAIAPAKIAGTAAILGANSFTGDQSITGNLTASGSITGGFFATSGSVSAGAGNFNGNNGSQIVLVQQSGTGNAILGDTTGGSVGVFGRSQFGANGVGVEGVFNAGTTGTGTAGLFVNTVQGKILSGVSGGFVTPAIEVFSVAGDGTVSLRALGTATATTPFNSGALEQTASAFVSGPAVAVAQTFQWRAEPVGNNTAAPSAKLSLLFGSGATAPAPTGLSIAANGTITFATGQTFTGVSADLLDGIDSTQFARVDVPNNFNGVQNITGAVTATGNVSGSQLVSTVASGTAPLVVSSNTQVANLNATSVGGVLAADIARRNATNTFTATQTINNAALTVSNASGSSTFSGGIATPLVDIQQSSGGAALRAQNNVIFGLGDALVGEVTGVTASGIAVKGVVASSTSTPGVFDNQAGGNILVGQVAGTNKFRFDGTGKGFFNGGQQTGGADFAESVDAVGEKDTYEPGDVLVIDVGQTRSVERANEPYSTRVAGIYSTKPGVLATPHGMDDTRLAGEIPMAILGIVPCKVSAENGPIERGDLLVASSTPGHAMKGTDRGRMLGAIVGKALEPLREGTGVIQVLVTLQ